MALVEVRDANSCFGYGKPPWRFRGSALYQLHLVKTEIARALIPKEFRLVEAFGYTLGGFFLANYEESPAGAFNELVVIAGTVWNPPTSCAWAAKVLVNSVEACLHGRKHVGLPSQVARFSKHDSWCPEQRLIACNPRSQEDERLSNNFLNLIGIVSTPQFHMSTQVSEISDHAASDMFSINFLSAAPKGNDNQWLGPSVKMSLPSFSGRTEDIPNLLKYSCQMECRLRLVQPVYISGQSSAADCYHVQHSQNLIGEEGREPKEDRSHLILSVMLSKPVLALEFNCLQMNVEAPLIVSQRNG